MLALAAERFEPVAGGDLAELAVRRLAGEPGEETGHRGAVAAVRGPGAGELDRVLAGFRQEARIGRAKYAGAGLIEPVEDP